MYIFPHQPSKNNIIIEMSRVMNANFGDDCIIPLIEDLKSINEPIQNYNSSVFKEFPVLSDEIINLYNYLKDFSGKTDMGYIPKNYPFLIHKLYNYNTGNHPIFPEVALNYDDIQYYGSIMHNISVINTHVPQVKKDQIFYSVRLDDILNKLNTLE